MSRCLITGLPHNQGSSVCVTVCCNNNVSDTISKFVIPTDEEALLIWNTDVRNYSPLKDAKQAESKHVISLICSLLID